MLFVVNLEILSCYYLPQMYKMEARHIAHNSYSVWLDREVCTCSEKLSGETNQIHETQSRGLNLLLKNSSRSDLSWHLNGHLWPIECRHLLQSSTKDQRVDGKATHTRKHKHCTMLRARWSGYHKLLTRDILFYGIPLRVCHVGAGHVLHLTGILSEASYGLNFCTSFYSPLYPCKAVLIYRK